MAKASNSLRCYSWSQLWTVLISPWRPSTVSCNQPLAAACQGFTYFSIQDLWVVVFELPPLKTHDMMIFLVPQQVWSGVVCVMAMSVTAPRAHATTGA